MTPTYLQLRRGGSCVGASSPQSCASNLRGLDSLLACLSAPSHAGLSAQFMAKTTPPTRNSRPPLTPRSSLPLSLSFIPSSRLPPLFPPSPHFTFSANYGSHCALGLNMDQKRERRIEKLNSDPSGYNAGLKTLPCPQSLRALAASGIGINEGGKVGEIF